MSSTLTVAYTRGTIDAGPGDPLAGMIARRGRFATSVRDPLSFQVLDLRVAGKKAALLSADLLVVPATLHREIATRAGIPIEELMMCATHTHSSLGGYWDLGKRGEIFMGAYRPEIFERLCASMSHAVRETRAAAGKPASVAAAKVAVEGTSRNRRKPGGPIDPDLLVVRVTIEGESPLDLVSYGMHPVLVAESVSGAVSADFPGALRQRLSCDGVRTIFLQGATGATNPALGASLETVASALEASHAKAVQNLEPIAVDALHSSRIEIPIARLGARVLPPTRWSRAGELLLSPLRIWMRRMAVDALGVRSTAPLHLLRLGEVAILGTPCDLGPGVSLELKRALVASGSRFAMALSHCNGYVGYVLRREDYDHVPARSERFLTLYENAMSLSGWDLGEAFVDATRRM